jgi:hypothetical protein
MEIWRGSELPLKMNPVIHNLKNSVHPPFAPFWFWYLAVTVSFWLPFRFVTSRSAFYSGSNSWLVPFRFCFISDFRFTFLYAPFLAPFHFCCSSISVSFWLHLFDYISITVPQICFSSVASPLQFPNSVSSVTFPLQFPNSFSVHISIIVF